LSKKTWINKNSIKSKFDKVKGNIDENSQVFFSIDKSISPSEITDEKLKSVEKYHQQKKKSKKIWKILFLLINIGLVFMVFYNFAHEQGGIQPLSTLFSNAPRWSYIFVAIGLYFVTVLFNGMKFLILIHHRTGKWRPWFSIKLGVVGRYYDLITPLGSGGQPFEIYYLKKDGYSGETSTAIPLAKYMFWQFTFLLICLLILIFHSSTSEAKLVVILAWIGLAINLTLFLFVFFMSITRKWGAALVVGVLKLLSKMKIIKNYKKTLKTVLRFVKQYQTCIKSFAKSPLTIISMFIVTALSTISNALIAYYVYISFVDVPIVSAFEIVCKCLICELAVCFVPLPGGSGASEISFNAMLGSLFPEGTLFWGILIWRILTYYAYIIHGAIALIIGYFTSKFKKRPKTEENQVFAPADNLEKQSE